MSKILDELHAAEEEYRLAYQAAEAKRSKRDELLRRALERHSQTEVANALGLTRGRIGQLATRLRRPAA